MTSLLTNNAAMTALTTLKSINAQLDMTSNRVSTGQRVSNAADNAAYWSIATTVRSDNASLGAVKDSLGLGSSAVDTAYNGLNSIITDLQNIRAKLQTALTPGVDRSKVQTEITAIQNKMKATADSSTSSGQNWLSVNSATTNTSYQATQNVVAGFSRDATGTVTFSKIAVDVNAIKLYDSNATSVTTAATSGQLFGSTSLTGTALFTGGTADFDAATANEVKFDLTLGDGSTATITLNAATLASAASNLSAVTTTEFIEAINNQIAADVTATPLAGKVSASLDTAGRLTFKTTAAGAGGAGSASRITIQNAAVTATYTKVDVGFGIGVAGTDARTADGSAAGTSTAKGILDTLNGAYAISTINISGLVGTAGDTTLQNIITQVEQALAKVTDAGTKLGANKTQIDGQKVFVDTLMKANDRTIGVLVDADIEEESTKLKALQTQQQLGVQSLSIANTASQNVLSLFR
ncbi:MAG: flagellin [Methylobacterium sp.]|uniref:flagellin N-terminal helical domain-containing protein n=1 Tax=Methylobacterium sp. TaxID=409 RepID=UPI0025EAC41E|nr:flagellin [Methylobacterium sp.]MBX9931355.1 flagellin [Methylobacterium sp.]